MRILIDIGHPGHVHYFKNFIKLQLNKNNQICVIARDKEVTHKLLDLYEIEYRSRGKGGNNLFTKLLYIPIGDWMIFKEAKKFNPDIFMSFGSTYAGHVAFLMKKPHIVFDDTEHAKIEHFMYKPFSSSILTPTCFYGSLGVKQIRFNSYMELCYLYEKYFSPNNGILCELKVNQNEQYAIIRFISWNANHDIGQKGLTFQDKKNLIEYLSKKMKVFISSEENLPQEFKKYSLQITPDKFHDALAFSSIYVGEGGTTASEASMLGIPTIYINTLMMGYLKDAEENGILTHFNNFDGVINKIQELLNISNLRDIYQKKRINLLRNKIDPVSFMSWFIENYPDSAKIMKHNPDYQYRFK